SSPRSRRKPSAVPHPFRLGSTPVFSACFNSSANWPRPQLASLPGYLPVYPTRLTKALAQNQKKRMLAPRWSTDRGGAQKVQRVSPLSSAFGGGYRIEIFYSQFAFRAAAPSFYDSVRNTPCH